MNEECWVIVYYGDSLSNSYASQRSYLPMYPDEVSDTQNAIWSSQQIIGRSNPLHAYTGTDSRNISFSMSLHREMYGSDALNMNKIEKILRIFRAALYPKYNTIGLIPPRIRVVIGELAVEGILTSLSINWKKPIINKVYMACDVSVQITGTSTKIYSTEELGTSSNPYNVSLNYMR